MSSHPLKEILDWPCGTIPLLAVDPQNNTVGLMPRAQGSIWSTSQMPQRRVENASKQNKQKQKQTQGPRTWPETHTASGVSMITNTLVTYLAKFYQEQQGQNLKRYWKMQESVSDLLYQICSSQDLII